jgi:hypothetical protein
VGGEAKTLKCGEQTGVHFPGRATLPSEVKQQICDWTIETLWRRLTVVQLDLTIVRCHLNGKERHTFPLSTFRSQRCNCWHEMPSSHTIYMNFENCVQDTTCLAMATNNRTSVPRDGEWSMTKTTSVDFMYRTLPHRIGQLGLLQCTIPTQLFYKSILK